MSALGNLEASYKTRDLESWFDLLFYRPVGYQLARLFAALHFTPSMVSALGAGRPSLDSDEGDATVYGDDRIRKSSVGFPRIR